MMSAKEARDHTDVENDNPRRILQGSVEEHWHDGVVNYTAIAAAVVLSLQQSLDSSAETKTPPNTPIWVKWAAKN